MWNPMDHLSLRRSTYTLYQSYFAILWQLVNHIDHLKPSIALHHAKSTFMALQETITINILSYQLNFQLFPIQKINTRIIISSISTSSILIQITDLTCINPTSIHDYIVEDFGLCISISHFLKESVTLSHSRRFTCSYFISMSNLSCII